MRALFDIGGTHIRIGVAKTFDTLDNSVIVHTPQDFFEGMDVLIKNIQELAKGEKITAVAGGIAGPLDSPKNMLVSSPNLPLWVGKPITATISEKLKAPVFLQNDAAMGGLGEAVYGAGKGKSIVAYLAVGTGVGGVRIVDGKIDMNVNGFEPGHQIIVIDGKEDACGPKGHLEAYISGKALKALHGKAPEDIVDSAVWHEVARFLAIGLNNTIVHWSPDVVVLTGSVGLHIPLDVVTEYLSTLMTIFPTLPQIVYGTLAKLSGLYGSLQYLKTQEQA